MRQNSQDNDDGPQYVETEPHDQEYCPFRSLQEPALALNGCSLCPRPDIGNDGSASRSDKGECAVDVVVCPDKIKENPE